MRRNREIKSYCNDFRPIRRILRNIGATLVAQKDQVDYFFFLPGSPTQAGPRRLKLRIDDAKARLIYYYDKGQPGSRSVEFQVLEVSNPKIKDLLETALGVRTVVRKRRDVWEKGNARFNLDKVENVGRILEVEIEGNADDDPQEQIAHYRRLFAPYLGADITGSNEDLVAASAAGTA